MTDQPIQFRDGAAYERMMGIWSRLAGEVFLDWLRPAPGLRSWVDIGCGNGAFTELVVDRCRPKSIEGIDPSEAQIDYARKRHQAGIANFREGSAMALPYADKSFDAATMALVIFFVPEPAVGLAEMVRVVRPGGVVAAYAWDMLGGGFPHEPAFAAMRDMGEPPNIAPRSDVVGVDKLQALWEAGGLTEVEAREIVVERPFDDFEAFWSTVLLSPSNGEKIAALSPAQRDELKERTRRNVATDASGRQVYTGRAAAVKGIVPRLKRFRPRSQTAEPNI